MPQQGPGRRLRRQVAKAKALEQLEAQEREQGLLVDHAPEYELIGRSKDPQLIIRGVKSWGASAETKARILKRLDDATKGELAVKTAINIAKVVIAIDSNELKKASVLLGAEKVGLGPQVKESSVDAPESTEMSGDAFFDKLLEAATTVEQVNTLRKLVALVNS